MFIQLLLSPLFSVKSCFCATLTVSGPHLYCGLPSYVFFVLQVLNITCLCVVSVFSCLFSSRFWNQMSLFSNPVKMAKTPAVSHFEGCVLGRMCDLLSRHSYDVLWYMDLAEFYKQTNSLCQNKGVSGPYKSPSKWKSVKNFVNVCRSKVQCTQYRLLFTVRHNYCSFILTLECNGCFSKIRQP